MTSNQIRFLELQEEKRANKAKEQETNRSNLESEAQKRRELEYNKYGNNSYGGIVRTIKAGFEDLGINTSNMFGQAVGNVATDLADKYDNLNDAKKALYSNPVDTEGNLLEPRLVNSIIAKLKQIYKEREGN